MFEWLFGYSSTIYDSASWGFLSTRAFHWYWIILLLVFLFIATTLVRARRRTHPVKLIIIGALQTLIIASALLLFWQPALLNERTIPNQNSLAVMLDTSTSMTNADNGEARINTAITLTANQEFSDLEEVYNIQRHTFSEQSARVDDYSNEPALSPQTKIFDSLQQVLQQASTESLAAVVLISDGAEAQGTITSDQLNQIAAFGVPVHTIGVGREKIAEDIELQNLVLPETVLPNTRVTAEVSIRHDVSGMARLKVYDGQTFLASKEITLMGDGPITNASIDLDIGSNGSKLLRFRLDPLADEQNLLNNSITKLLNVEDKAYRVLYLEGEPRWEYKFIRRALAHDSTVELHTLLWLSENKFYRQGIENQSQLENGFPSSKEELFSYDAVIIGSLKAPELNTEQQTLLHDFVSLRGGSLLLLAGRHGLGAGGWGNSLIAKTLPANLPSNDNAFIRNRVKVALTAQGASATQLKFNPDPALNLERWQQLPELADYQKIGALRPAATTLLTANLGNEKHPLLITQPYGRGSSSLLATSGTWRWRMNLPAEDVSHQTFWRQLVRSLVASSTNQFDFSVRANDDVIELRVDVRADDYTAMDNMRISVVANHEQSDTTSNSQNIELTAVLDRPGSYYANFKPELQSSSGTWYFTAIASQGDEPVHSAEAALFVGGDDSEYFNIRQNKTQLQRLAEATGGQYWPADNITGMAETLATSNAGITEQIIRPLWFIPIFFIWLLLLKSIEWLLRRSWGLI